MLGHAFVRSVFLACFVLESCSPSTVAFPTGSVNILGSEISTFLQETTQHGHETAIFFFTTLWTTSADFKFTKGFVPCTITMEIENNGFLSFVHKNYRANVISTRYINMRECRVKTKRWHKSRVSYYNNSDATFNFMELAITLSGDVHPLPGPDFGTSSAIKTWITNRHMDRQLVRQLRSQSNHSNYSAVDFRRNNNFHRNLIIIPIQQLMKSANRTVQNKATHGQPHCIKISHLNVRSLKNRVHFHQVHDLITSGDFDVFSVSESWLNSSVKNSEINISGYRLVRLDRTGRSGAGVCAYVRDSLKVTILRDLTAISADGFEQLWLSLQHKNLKSLVICVAYRAPDVPSTCFTNDLIPAYSQVAMLGRDIILTGDLNCDLLSDKPESRALRALCSILNLH